MKPYLDDSFLFNRCEPQLRFSLALCSEERAFAERRRKKVFEAMKEILGEDAPTKERDVHILLSFYKKYSPIYM